MRNSNTLFPMDDADDNDKKPSRKANKISAPPNRPKPKKAAVAAVRVIWMTLDEWAKVPANPFQKQNRAKRTNIAHLRNFVDDHASVRMGIYPDGSRCKIDGHTRCDIWQNRPWLVDFIPARLRVECVPVKNDADAAARFNRVDNRKNAKNAADDVHGSFRLAGVNTASVFFQNANNIKAGLNYAYGVVMSNLLSEISPQERAARLKKTTIDDQVRHFFAALNALDAVHVNRAKLPAPFVTAFLIAYEKHGDDIVSFFQRVNAGTYGVKQGKKMCPIAAIERERDLHSGGGQQQHMELVVKVLGALDRYMQGNFTRPDYQPNVDMQKVMTVDIDQYLVRDKARRTGRTVEKRRGNGNRNNG